MIKASDARKSFRIAFRKRGEQWKLNMEKAMVFGKNWLTGDLKMCQETIYLLHRNYTFLNDNEHEDMEETQK